MSSSTESACPKCGSTHLGGLMEGFWVSLNPDGSPAADWAALEAETEVGPERMCYDCNWSTVTPPAEQQGEGVCPCELADAACSPQCPCVNEYSSAGCLCCCRYGSKEQRKNSANRLVKQQTDQPDLADIRRDAELAPSLADALQDLVDWQNGPPLLGPKWEPGWRRAMDKATSALKRWDNRLDESSATTPA